MNWKATTAVTGVTTLAGWLMTSWLWTAPPHTGVAPDRGGTRDELTDIVREAERLHRGVSDAVPFEQPTRNPFRFGERPVAAVRPPPAPVELLPPSPEPPPPPPVTLVAIAADTVDGVLQRTAVLNTRQGIVVAREGEVVGDYRVNAISDEGVELVSLLDESVRRLAVK